MTSHNLLFFFIIDVMNAIYDELIDALSDILNDAIESMAQKPLCNRKAGIFYFGLNLVF
jgi:hypothetical protein